MCYEGDNLLKPKMVMCERGSLRSASGFRLSGRESVSSASLYKQRIDSMFDEERSVISQNFGANSHNQRPPSVGSYTIRSKAPSFTGRLDGPGGLAQSTGSLAGSIGASSGNSVQANIERMFSELALEADGPAPGTHSFSVDYLGSTPLPRRVTSLSGLQAPLARLYLAYRKTRPASSNLNTPELAARLDISRAGLHVRHCGPRGDLEQLNPFPTIAVWSAVKFVLQPSEEDTNIIQYAFLPLITDPDNIDKQALFKILEPSEKKYILGRDMNAHSPLFTVVMRKIGVAKQLECHGFICQTSEDAIVIAATLYKSLMAHMSRVPRARGGIAGPSIASSIAPVRPPRRKRTTSSASVDSDKLSIRQDSSTKGKSLKSRRTPENIEPPSQIPPPPPPPNKKTGIEQVKAKLATIKTNTETSEEQTNKNQNTIYNESMEFLSKQHKNSSSSKDSSVRSKVSEKVELFSSIEKNKNIPRPSTLPPPVPIKPKKEEDTKIKEDENNKKNEALKTTEPLRRSHSLRNSLEPGDILTKVAIPRSGSFLNASGLSRYKSTGHRNNGKKGGGSPLGFSELFNEFRVQEDLHSMDDILGAIIDSEGMSFNDLKPIYKEFLLKLAVTLTKDELFQHSKAIMKRQKKKLTRRNSSVQNKRKKILIGAKGLKLVFRKPFGKDVLKNKILNFSDRKRKIKHPNPFELPKATVTKNKLLLTSESSVSTSSYDLRHFNPKEEIIPAPKRQSVRRRNSKRAESLNNCSKSKKHAKNKVLERISTSEDSDFLTLSRKMGCQNRNSSSGYVSCSECESEGCADRCYCAARVRPRQQKTPLIELDCCARDTKCLECNSGDFNRCYSCCGCDTESCADSDKCYCHTGSICGNPLVGGGVHAVGRPRRSPRRRSAPGPATLDSLYYEPFRSKSRSVIDHRTSGLEYMNRRNSKFDTFERLSCMTDLGRTGTAISKGRKSYSSDNLALDYDLFMSQNGFPHVYGKKNTLRKHVISHSSTEALMMQKSNENTSIFSDGRLLSAHRGLYRGPSAALVDSLGYLP